MPDMIGLNHLRFLMSRLWRTPAENSGRSDPTKVWRMTAEMVLSNSWMAWMELDMHGVQIEVDLRGIAMMTVVEAHTLRRLCTALASRGLLRPVLIADAEAKAVLHIFGVLSAFVLESKAKPAVVHITPLEEVRGSNAEALNCIV